MGLANSYDCYPAFVIRTPCYSLKKLDEIPPLAEKITGFIREQWSDPVIKDAFIAASPDFVSQIEAELAKGSVSDSLADSFIRYFIRMSFRCTPFGLFAGIGTGEISGENNIRIKNPEEFVLRGRLDMEFLGAYVNMLISNREFADKLDYRANNSLYKTGSKWRYIEVFFKKGSRKKYSITALESNEALDDIIEKSGTLRSWKDLVGQLVKVGYPGKDAENFIEELVRSQILIPHISPNLTGQEFSRKLTGWLSNFSGKSGIINDFIELDSMLNKIVRPGQLYMVQREIQGQAGKIIPGLNPSRLIQLDMNSALERSVISQETTNNVLLGIRILKALSFHRPNKVLESFREYFAQRFESREVPLPLVMDSDIGVGLDGPQGQQMNDPGPLLDGLDFPLGAEHGSPVAPHPVLQRKMKSFDSSGSHYIELEKSDIKELGLRKGDWPSQMFAMCQLGGEDGSEIIFRMASGGNPGFLMGRFGFLNDGGRIDKHIREMTRDDIFNHPGEILAEIVHLPEDRTGNILQRPSYFDWEIPYLANPGGEARVINPADILVSLSQEKIVLTHRKYRKKIIPRLTNAHNYRGRQLPLYQFLCELAREDSGPAYFPNWGWLSGLYDLSPGIRYGNLILSLARWRLKLDDALRNTRERTQLYKKIREWADSCRLPGKVVWSQGDHELVVDWSNFNVVMALWDSIRKNKYVVFYDYPYDRGSPVASDNGQYANEVLITFKNLENEKDFPSGR